MSEKLKPCPFCGGEAKIQEYNGGFAAVGCSNGRCYMHPHAFGFASAEDAIQKWNRRVERTCSLPIVRDEEECERQAGAGVFVAQEIPLCRKCTSCGRQYPPVERLPEGLRYCPYCGAKVVPK